MLQGFENDGLFSDTERRSCEPQVSGIWIGFSVHVFRPFDCNVIVTLIAIRCKFIRFASPLALQFPSGSVGMPKTETLNLRVSTEFKRRLMEEAAREKRSVTNYLEVTITAVWDQRQSSAKTTKGKRQSVK